MKIFCLARHNAQEGCCLHWCQDPSELRQVHERLSEEFPEDTFRADPVDIPLSRVGIVRWLNNNFTHDND